MFEEFSEKKAENFSPGDGKKSNLEEIVRIFAHSPSFIEPTPNQHTGIYYDSNKVLVVRFDKNFVYGALRMHEGPYRHTS